MLIVGGGGKDADKQVLILQNTQLILARTKWKFTIIHGLILDMDFV